MGNQGEGDSQNYNREAPRLATQVGRYAHAKQYKRMRKTLRTLRGRVGRVHREVERKVADILWDSEGEAQESRRRRRAGWLRRPR